MAKTKAKPAAASASTSPTRKYELTYIMPTTYTDTELNGFKKEVEALITKHSGKVVGAEDWGKNKLAYKIKHHGKLLGDGIYTHVLVSFSADSAQEFEKEMYRYAHNVRHLFLVSDDAQKAATPQE
ncbi:MAG: 30S ribosomal protein S6 [bacterium]|nr:30S ribosomal protein S6 [bacterium]